MSYTSYADMPGLLSRRREFTGNSASARWTDSETYAVYSYSTVIATYSPTAGWNIPEEHYSRTTSRLQNLIRRIA